MTFLERFSAAARIVSILIIAAFTITCGGDSGSGPGDDGDGGPTTLSISLAVSSAMPPDEIDIDGIPGGMDVSSLYAAVTSAGGIEYASLLGRRDDNSVYMAAPLNADDPGAAGDITVRVTDGGDVTSNTVNLRIEELPPATTTMADIVTALQGLMDSRLALHGRTREELRAMPVSSMTSVDIALFFAQEILDSPDNPNSLRASVDGPVPFFENAALDFDLADRLLSRSGFEGFLGEETASVDSLIAEPDPDTLLTSTVVGPLTGRGGRPATLQITGCIDQGDLGINNAPSLHRAMSMGRFSVRRLDGASGTVVKDVATVFSILGMAPDATAKAIAKTVGGVAYVYKLLNDASSKLFPTGFDNSRTQFTPDPSSFNEDSPSGRWNDFKVTAVSEGWELDQDALKALLKLAKLSDLGGIRNLFNGPGDPDLQKNFSSYLITQAVKAIIGEVTEGQDLIRVCPGEWPDIDCTFPMYSKPSIISGTAIEFINGEHNTYKPKEAGTSELRVETHPDRFGGALAFRIHPIQVKEIQVFIEPTSTRAEAEEILTFEARVENADNPDFRWIVPDGFTTIDGFDNFIVIQCPNQPWNPSALLKARSIANTGLREGKSDSDPREGLATIMYDDSVRVRINPGFKCVSNGENFTFVAEVFGVEEYTVKWKRESGYGQINENTGVYTAPNTGTTDDVISAEVVGFPDAKDYASVRVGACKCNYKINIAGAAYLDAEGGDIAYQFYALPDSFHNYAFFIELSNPGIPEDAGIGMAIVPTEDGIIAPFPGDTGTYDLQFSFFNGSDAWTSGGENADMTIDILEHTDTYMIAEIFGTITQGEGVNRTSCTVSGTFKAGRWTAGWPCTAD